MPIPRLSLDGFGLRSSIISSTQINAPPQTINAVIALPVIWVFVNTIRLWRATNAEIVNHRFLGVGAGNRLSKEAKEGAKNHFLKKT
jgi:hypothetical protein